MREIKCRGKRIDNGEWVYGYLFKIWEQTYILWGTTNGVPNMIEVIPETVGQYTGMKDKNVREIYEGDIIKSQRGYRMVVEWVDDGRFLGFTKERSIAYVGQEPAVEVIGSIHDNPGLLTA